MLTIFSHELERVNHSIGSYVYCGTMMLAVGVAALYYNINSAVANFEYVLATVSMAYGILVPILTMKSIAEERKQKTDQLLYSLPLSMWEIVIGKYLAYLVVLFIPMIFIGIYPIVFAKFGNVYLPTSYGTLFAFFLVGAAWTAVGMFISSLTESLPFAAIGTAAIILINYYLTSLASFISDSFSNFMANFSLFEKLFNFVDGVFDMTAIVFFLSVIGVFLFLCVQTLEKRRYS